MPSTDQLVVGRTMTWEEGEEEDSLTKSEFSDAGDDGFPEIKTQKLM